MNYKYLLISSLSSILIGFALSTMIINSENGYVGGMIFLPILLFVLGLSVVLFAIGIIGFVSKNANLGVCFLATSFLLTGGFLGSCLTAKYFELGAYRQESMVPLIKEVMNVVVFKEGTTDEQLSNFRQKVMSIKRNDGRGNSHLPGVQETTVILNNSGREAIAFSFFPSATDEQKLFVYSQVRSSPIVDRLSEDQSISEFKTNSENSSDSSRQAKAPKTALIPLPTKSN